MRAEKYWWWRKKTSRGFWALPSLGKRHPLDGRPRGCHSTPNAAISHFSTPTTWGWPWVGSSREGGIWQISVHERHFHWPLIFGYFSNQVFPAESTSTMQAAVQKLTFRLHIYFMQWMKSSRTKKYLIWVSRVLTAHEKTLHNIYFFQMVCSVICTNL